MSKTLEEVLALDPAALTDEDKAVLKENEATLTDEQKAKFLPKEETAEEKTEREEKEKGDANEAAGLNRDGSAKSTEQEHSEKKVTISLSEYKILQGKADQGAEAFAQLEKAEIEAVVSKMVFNNNNKAGKFLPKSEAALRTFTSKLSKDQRKAFAELVVALPESNKFSEIGSDNEGSGTAQAEVEAKVAKKLETFPTMKYSTALKQVMSENAGLEERYDRELPTSKKKD